MLSGRVGHLPTNFDRFVAESKYYLPNGVWCRVFPEGIIYGPPKFLCGSTYYVFSTFAFQHATVLNTDMRLSFCRALILLRHKDLLEPAVLLQLCFDLLRCQDKALRKYLRDHIVSDLKSVNSKHKDIR